MKVSFTLNNKPVDLDIHAQSKLSDILCGIFGLDSYRKGCDKGECGRCLALINNTPVYSCLVPAFTLKDRVVLTSEGFEETEDYKRIYNEFEKQGFQPCALCKGEKYLLIYSLLNSQGSFLSEEVSPYFAQNYCHCLEVSLISRVIRELKGKMDR